MGETTRFGGGSHRGTGYLTYLEPVGACVLVLHEFFGLTPSFMHYADRLQEEGFTALVPDLYEGKVAADVEEAKALARSLDEERTTAILKEAVDHMRMNWHPRVGVVGFSLGAFLGVDLAQHVSLDAVVAYYGLAGVDVASWETPLLVHAAEHDEWEPLDDMRSAASGIPEAEFHVYPGAAHGFANQDVPDAYDADAAETAFARTLDFFRYHLS